MCVVGRQGWGEEALGKRYVCMAGMGRQCVQSRTPLTKSHIRSYSIVVAVLSPCVGQYGHGALASMHTIVLSQFTLADAQEA